MIEGFEGDTRVIRGFEGNRVHCVCCVSWVHWVDETETGKKLYAVGYK